MKLDLLVPFATGENVQEAIHELFDRSLPNVEDVLKKALQYCKGKKITHYAVSNIDGFRMVSFIIKGEKSKGNLTQGYTFAYVHNMSEPMFSELGDIVIEKREGEFYRVG